MLIMEKYNPGKIESKWQKIWKDNPNLYSASEKSGSKKAYILDMFPYPSGEGLHVGHVESYTATDIVSRYLRMKGKNVLHPQGFDAFGLPAENYAIKTGVHPSKTTQKAIETFKKQINSMGFSYDWSREVNSSDPAYYRWTQWFFLLLYKNGLAYRKKAKANWCPKCQTVLANEQAEGGKCERCETEVVQKELEQWFFKITDFIEDRPLILRGSKHGSDEISDIGMSVGTSVGTSEYTLGLLNGLEKVDWPESTKAAQRNWIGKSEGTIIKFKITNDNSSLNSQEFKDEYLEVFTTRLDTIYGCTYCVVAPEHKIIEELKKEIKNYSEVEKYLVMSQKKTDLDRMEAKDKTGVEIKGIKAINPFNNEEVPIFVADYVLGHYGTGAVMAVPAHDERDFEFAKKYKLTIKRVIEPIYTNDPDSPSAVREGKEFIKRDAVVAIVKNPKNNSYLCINWKNNVFMHGLVTGGINNGESIVEAARREVKEESGYKNLKLIKVSDISINCLFYHLVKKENRWAHFQYVFFDLENEDRDPVSKEESFHEVLWKKKDELMNFFSVREGKFTINLIDNKDFVFTEFGILAGSDKYSGITSEKAREKMADWLEKNKLGERKVNYKIRDWLVSRQRYWGAPIPIIYCEKCGEIPVSEKDLPVELPDDVDFKPTGESPLKYSKKFQNVKCPKCGGKAKRESDTMDTFVCSSWYYLRYSDPKNEKEFASKDKLKKWLPVDLYVGGAEHSVLHLLYSRFFTKVLHSLGYLSFDEPFLKLRHQGIILAENGEKMSKSKGNVTNPDDVIAEFGADSLRLYEMFMGPLEDMKPWNTKGIIGVKRFLDKVWKLQSSVIGHQLSEDKTQPLLHKTIKKITEDIENLKFNTAISALMILVNEMEKQKKIPTVSYQILVTLLSPFAPHLAEELWEKVGHKKSIFKEKWPNYNPKLIKDEEVELVVQVNGKLRDRLRVSVDISEEEAKKLVMESEKVKKFISGREIKKSIFIKGKLINLVV